MSFSSIRQTPPCSAVSYATAAGITASERGAFLHEALFRIWHEIKSSDGLAGLSEAAEIDLVEAAVTGAMQHVEHACETRGYSLRERAGQACWHLEQQLCIEILCRWLTYERKRTSSFRVVEMEKNKRCKWRIYR